MAKLTRRHVFAAGLLPLLGRWRSLAAEAIGTVVAVVNSATSKAPARTPQPVTADSAIFPGEEIHTDDRSAIQVALVDGSVVTIGANGDATFGALDAGILVSAGSLRFRTGAGAPAEPRLATPTLMVNLHQAEMIVTVAPAGATTCGVVRGRITCTSIKKGTAVEVNEGQSVRWSDGAFGEGVMNVAYVSGDVAVDSGMVAAASEWGKAAPLAK